MPSRPDSFSSIRLALAVLVLGAALPAAQTASSSAIGDIVKAQILINKALEIKRQFDTATEQPVTLVAPEPIKGNSGKYLLPYKADGELTAWAEKGLGVTGQAGSIAGKKAGEAAGKALASKVPMGGLLSGAIAKKGQEIGASVALGGIEAVKSGSELSFAALNDYAVYLQAKHGSDGNFKDVLAVAIALYPDLEGRFQGAIQEAYKAAQARSAAKK